MIKILIIIQEFVSLAIARTKCRTVTFVKAGAPLPSKILPATAASIIANSDVGKLRRILEIGTTSFLWN